MAKRLLRKLSCHDGTWHVQWQELDNSGGLTKFSLTSKECVSSVLETALASLRVVPQVVCGINPCAPEGPINAVGVSGITLTYGKDSGARILKCSCFARSIESDEYWKFNTPEICESDIDGHAMPRYMVNMLDGLINATWRFIDGERKYNEVSLFADIEGKEVGGEDAEAAELEGGSGDTGLLI